MPLIINQMPSGAYQFPPMAPNRSDMYAAQAAAFMNQPSSRKESDTAALLALVQYMSQGRQMNLERELRRDDLALRREELANILSESQANREVTREGMADARAQSKQQFDFLQGEMEKKYAALLKQLDILGTEAKSRGDMTQANVEQIRAAIQEMVANRNMLEQAQKDSRAFAAAGIINERSKGEAAGAIAAADDKSEIAIQEARSGFESGLASYPSFERDDLKPPLTRLLGGSSVYEDDVSKITTGLIEETKAVTEAAKAMKDPHARTALLAKQNEKLKAVRTAISDPSRLTSWADTSRDWTGLSRWFKGGDDVLTEKQRLLGMAVDQSERLLKRGGAIPSVAATDAYLNTLAPGVMKEKSQAKAQASETAANRSDALFRVLSSPDMSAERVFQIMAPEQAPYGPRLPVAQSQPANDPQFDLFLRGLTGR
jgi:hypothetical protein